MGSVVAGARWSPIRIVARDGKKWKANPLVDEVEEDWILYIVEDKPLECLEWDPEEYTWRDEQGKSRGFFDYSTRLGRYLCLHREKCVNKWTHIGVDSVFVDKTRSKIWNSPPLRGSRCFFG